MIRTINPAKTFDALVQWFHDEIILRQGAPGLLVGLSGTDSLVAFCAAAKAFELDGKPDRVLGVHFAPSQDFLYDHPEAEVHLWFRDKVVPWLHEQAPNARILIDTSIDWRCDGQRWGALMDLSVVSTGRSRMMRLPEDQYWVVGTRNRTEDSLLNYSNASMAVSIQPLIHLWKSEILQLSEYLGAPQIVIDKSCETDCICGRLRLPSQHIREVDMLIMADRGEMSRKYVEDNIPADLRHQLNKFITAQIVKNEFKTRIPYSPKQAMITYCNDPLVIAFEDGSLNLSEFNHRKHVYVAWCYLKFLPSGTALERYCHYLRILLDSNGQSHRFNLAMTKSYFELLDKAMRLDPADSFDEMMAKSSFKSHSKTSA